MRRVRPLLFSLPLLALASLHAPVAAQGPAGTSQPATPYTLRTATRLVLLDVTVTDSAGHPVHGLPQTAFHIEDSREPQTLAGFDEHSPADASVPLSAEPSAPAVFSNRFTLQAQPVLNLLLLDISNLAMQDQLFLDVQLERLISALPAGEPLAIFTRSSGICTLAENFTADHARLRAAVRRTLPRPFEANPFLDDSFALQQITAAVAQLPGRKNLLWFSGGAALRFYNPVMLDQNPVVYRNDARVRAVYDGLEAARIAVYPIDARGANTLAMRGEMAQHAMMDEIALATGGHATYSNNGLAARASSVVADSRSFYTLTYTPHHFQADHRWHSIRVRVDDPSLRLSYRAGYFSDSPPPPNRAPVDPSQPDPNQPSSLAGAFAGNASESLLSKPIIFNAEVLPAAAARARHGTDPPLAELTSTSAPHHGAVPYDIRYTVPAANFAVQTIKGKPAIVINAAAVAFNADGTAVAHIAGKLTLTIDPAHLPLPPGTQVPLVQHMALSRGDLSLYLALWDPASGHMGTLQIPLQVKAP